MMNSNIDAISLNDLFLIYWNMAFVFNKKVYMKNIVLDLWDDSSRIQFKEEYSNLLEEEKEILNLTQLVWYGKNNKSKCNQSDLHETLSVPVIVTIKIYSKAGEKK